MKSVFGQGSAPDRAGGAHDAPRDPSRLERAKSSSQSPPARRLRHLLSALAAPRTSALQTRFPTPILSPSCTFWIRRCSCTHLNDSRNCHSRLKLCIHRWLKWNYIYRKAYVVWQTAVERITLKIKTIQSSTTGMHSPEGMSRHPHLWTNNLQNFKSAFLTTLGLAETLTFDLKFIFSPSSPKLQIWWNSHWLLVSYHVHKLLA